mmetsp:Transcript_5418/g.9808  ORF Transcript_5418/g.9808 Transcript_5418/m.9808 type:complete len:111 (+) Transcript_5418:717-1049(+)
MMGQCHRYKEYETLPIDTGMRDARIRPHIVDWAVSVQMKAAVPTQGTRVHAEGHSMVLLNWKNGTMIESIEDHARSSASHLFRRRRFDPYSLYIDKTPPIAISKARKGNM